MFEQVFENLQKATESSVKMQQEMFQKWVDAFPSASLPIASSTDAFAEWRKKWEEATADLFRRQKELVDQNYEAGIKGLEEIFAVAESQSPQEYQQKVTELYQKSFESLRQLSEAQMTEFKTAVAKCSELMSTSGV